MSRPRAIRGSWLAVIAALLWAVPALGIPSAILRRALDPEPVTLVEAGAGLLVFAVVAAVFGGLGWVFWVPARRRSDAHVRELLEERRNQPAPPTGG